jgi:hypothetical protein
MSILDEVKIYVFHNENNLVHEKPRHIGMMGRLHGE